MHSLPVFVAGSQTAQSMLPDQLHRRVSSGWLGKGHAEAAQRLAADPPRGNQNRQVKSLQHPVPADQKPEA